MSKVILDMAMSLDGFIAGSCGNVWALLSTRWPAATSSPSTVRRSWPTAWKRSGRASPAEKAADREGRE
jgi:hypothetical protein